MIDRSSLRVALRTLGRHRGFTVVAVLSLAVAIALNTVMYSALDALIYPQIDARKPENVYSFYYFGNVSRRLDPTQIDNAIRAGARNFEALTGAQVTQAYMFSGQTPLAENGSRYKRVTPITVRANYFDFLGTRPREGRTFRAADELERQPATVISDRLARHLFPDQSPVGRTVTLDGRGLAVIGVVRRNSTFAPLAGDIWVLRRDTAVVKANLIRFTKRIEQFHIDEELKQVAAQLALADNDPTKWTAFRGKALKTDKFEFNSFHWALIGAVGAVLLVACANLANLQLARGLSRTRELALRSAVGASRRQLVNLLVLETALLALLGLALGVVLTLWGIKLVTASIPETINEILVEPQTSWRVFAFATGAAITCLFLVGLIPALRISRVDPNDLLKAGAGTGANREHRRRYGMMVVAQIGLALPVLIGAIVVLKATWLVNSDKLLLSRYGYDPRPIVSGSIPFTRAAKRVMLADIAAELTSRARSVPAVLESAVSDSKEPVKRRVTVDDENGVIRDEAAPLWSYDIVSPSYLRTFNQPIKLGRDFIDGESDGRAVIMDAPSAKFLWGNQNPIGRSIKLGDKDSKLPWLRVVGIVGDLRDTATIRRADYTSGFRLSNVYRVITPADSVDLNKWGYGSISFYARVRGSTELAAVRLQRNLRGMRAADKPGVIPLTDQMGVAQTRTQQTFVSSLFGTFALLGLGLVAIGVYGIVSHSVAERHRELAVRISLGATARDILHSVLREGNALILAGVAFGLLFTKYTVWWLSSFIEENDGYNALLFALIAAVLFAIAAVAAFVPAWRATRIDPVEALRSE